MSVVSSVHSNFPISSKQRKLAFFTCGKKSFHTSYQTETRGKQPSHKSAGENIPNKFIYKYTYSKKNV